MKDKYLTIYDTMKTDTWYTAKELGVAPASMTAMVRRNMVEATDTKPKQYKKVHSTFATILSILNEIQPDTEYFTLYKHNKELGMLCYIVNNVVLDCWGEPYDLADVYQLSYRNHFYEVE